MNDDEYNYEQYDHYDQYIDENLGNYRLPKIYIRDMDDPFERYVDGEFERRYRFSKNMIRQTLTPLVANLERESNRGLPIAPILQLLCCLRFYATGSFQLVCADLHGISQSTVSLIVKNVSMAIASHLPRYIKFPEPQELDRFKVQFSRKHHFPGVVGLIDCTHIPIQSPDSSVGEIYRNRKGIFSLNVQVVCGPDLQILDIVTRWPGSTHDSRVFANSNVKRMFEQRLINGYLIGDQGYAQTTYMFTPVPNPTTPAETRYNKAHELTRKPIECLFGIWKRKFPCLRRKLANSLSTILYIISACAVLHNVYISGRTEDQRAEDDNFDADSEDNDDEPNNVAPIQPAALQIGSAIRAAFIAQNFNR